MINDGWPAERRAATADLVGNCNFACNNRSRNAAVVFVFIVDDDEDDDDDEEEEVVVVVVDLESSFRYVVCWKNAINLFKKINDKQRYSERQSIARSCINNWIANNFEN